MLTWPEGLARAKARAHFSCILGWKRSTGILGRNHLSKAGTPASVTFSVAQKIAARIVVQTGKFDEAHKMCYKKCSRVDGA